MAGGERPTDELYPDARSAPSGTAAQDREGLTQRESFVEADWFRAVAFVEFPAQAAEAIAGGD